MITDIWLDEANMVAEVDFSCRDEYVVKLRPADRGRYVYEARITPTPQQALQRIAQATLVEVANRVLHMYRGYAGGQDSKSAWKNCAFTLTDEDLKAAQAEPSKQLLVYPESTLEGFMRAREEARVRKIERRLRVGPSRDPKYTEINRYEKL